MELQELKKLREELNIKVKNPGILKVPEDKNFWDLPLEHYIKLIKELSYDSIIKALVNLVRWNKNDNPEQTKKAQDIINKLQEWNAIQK